LNSIFLSIVIPVYNEERRLPTKLENVISFVSSQPYSSEVIVVENGSLDHTLQIALEFANNFDQIRVLRAETRGKGLAVQQGMLAAHGSFRFMCDADFSMPVDQINRFIPPALQDFDIAIASREAPGAIRYNEPQYRHNVGRIFNTLIRAIALPGLNDTQCGFKCFRAPVAEELFHLQTINGWSFDVELLFIARQRGYKIVELPIPWYFNPESKINVLRDSLRMATDLLQIRLNGLRGVYNPSHAIQD
jgi:glycosyltransferase involved in cell wall biosynthesis